MDSLLIVSQLWLYAAFLYYCTNIHEQINVTLSQQLLQGQCILNYIAPLLLQAVQSCPFVIKECLEQQHFCLLLNAMYGEIVLAYACRAFHCLVLSDKIRLICLMCKTFIGSDLLICRSTTWFFCLAALIHHYATLSRHFFRSIGELLTHICCSLMSILEANFVGEYSFLKVFSCCA